MTFVDYAEPIWRKLETATQQAVADDLGWSRGQISQYALLEDICDEAWKLIATTVASVATDAEGGSGYGGPKTVAFSERLLRDIIPLTPEQQLDLVEALEASQPERASDAVSWLHKEPALSGLRQRVNYNSPSRAGLDAPVAGALAAVSSPARHIQE